MFISFILGILLFAALDDIGGYNAATTLGFIICMIGLLVVMGITLYMYIRC
jgi:hypothetical protein